jgi:hypothetical protein
MLGADKESLGRSLGFFIASVNLQLQQVLWPGGLSKSLNGVNSELLNILMDINKFFPHYSPVARAFVMFSWGASKSQKRKCDT